MLVRNMTPEQRQAHDARKRDAANLRRALRHFLKLSPADQRATLDHMRKVRDANAASAARPTN